MIKEKLKHDQRRQVDAVKRLGRNTNSRGLHLPGLWACRMAAGLTQRDLALAIGSNQATIHELERSLRSAYPKTVRKLCEALNVEPADLLCAEASEQD